MEETLYRVNVGYACFGIIARKGIVVCAPPIARWMIWQTLQEIKPWLLEKKAKVEVVEF